MRIPPPPAANGYEVLVEPGLLDRLPALAAEAAPAARYAVVADASVAELYGPRVRDGFAGAGLAVELLTFPAGEGSKTRATWAALTDELLALGVGRDGCVVALGGGVACDLAGFVAATYLRGVPLVQVPTSLLAMVDAAVGGKTGVDTPAGKNLVGAFHFPRLVAMDPEVLATLPEPELRSGLAEAAKHGAIADPAYLAETVAAAPRLLARDSDALARLVRRSVEIKAGFVAEDPFEAGARAALNLGHTLGHGLEALSGYTHRHGAAVAVGTVAEALAGEAAGVTEPGTADALREALAALGLPTRLPSGTLPEDVLERARTDKKARAGRLRYTLLARLGSVARGDDGAWTIPLDDGLVLEALRRCTGSPEAGTDAV